MTSPGLSSAQIARLRELFEGGSVTGPKPGTREAQVVKAAKELIDNLVAHGKEPEDMGPLSKALWEALYK